MSFLYDLQQNEICKKCTSSNSFSCFTLEMNCSALHVFIHKIWKWHEWICTKEVQKEFINIYYANYIWLQGNYYLGKNILCKVKENSRMFTNYYLVLFDKFKKRGGKCQGRTGRRKKGASAWKRRNSFCWKDFQNGRTMLFEKQRIHLIALWFKSFCLTCPQRIVTHSGCWIRNENFSYSFATVRP